MIEIERKYLVRSNAFKKKATDHFTIIQGFLTTDPHRTVRVRLKNNNGFLAVKGISNASGMSRFEWETVIPQDEANDLLLLCVPPLLEKIRYIVPIGSNVFEVDEFKGVNEGLIIAEIELNHETDKFHLPDWLGTEVTGDIKYYNSQLCQNPFSKW